MYSKVHILYCTDTLYSTHTVLYIHCTASTYTLYCTYAAQHIRTLYICCTAHTYTVLYIRCTAHTYTVYMLHSSYIHCTVHTLHSTYVHCTVHTLHSTYIHTPYCTYTVHTPSLFTTPCPFKTFTGTISAFCSRSLCGVDREEVSYSRMWYRDKHICTYTVGPLYKGHIGTSYFVHCREVVHSSEVENVLVP